MPQPDITVDPVEESLLRQAAEVDSGRIGADEAPPETPSEPEKAETPAEPDRAGKVEPETTPETTPEREKTASEVIKDKERDEKGRFKPKEEGAEAQKGAETGPEKPEEKKDTEFSRAQKEKDRRDRSWAALEREKAETRAREAEISERERLIQLRQTAAEPQPVRKDGFTAPEYYKAYQDFKAQGDYESAARALETVIEIRNYEQQLYAQSAQQRTEAQYELAFRGDMEQAIQADPEIADPESPIAKEIAWLLNNHPYLYYLPQGFQRTVEVARMRVELGEYKQARDEYERVKAQLEERERKGQPAKGGFTEPVKEREFDDLSMEEKEKWLERASQRADAMA